MDITYLSVIALALTMWAVGVLLDDKEKDEDK